MKHESENAPPPDYYQVVSNPHSSNFSPSAEDGETAAFPVPSAPVPPQQDYHFENCEKAQRQTTFPNSCHQTPQSEFVEGDARQTTVFPPLSAVASTKVSAKQLYPEAASVKLAVGTTRLKIEPSIFPQDNQNVADHFNNLTKNCIRNGNIVKYKEFIKRMFCLTRLERQEMVNRLATHYFDFYKSLNDSDSRFIANIFFRDSLRSDCISINSALTAEEVRLTPLNDILCTKSDEYLSKLRNLYEEMFEQNLLTVLEREIDEKLFLIYKNLLTTPGRSQRISSSEDVKVIIKVLKCNDQRQELANLFTLYSYESISFLNRTYYQEKSVTFFDTFIEPLDGDFKDAIVILNDFALDPVKCYYSLFQDAMKYEKHGRLCRVMADRSEVDLKTIIKDYEKEKKISFKVILKYMTANMGSQVKYMLFGMCGYL